MRKINCKKQYYMFSQAFECHYVFLPFCVFLWDSIVMLSLLLFVSFIILLYSTFVNFLNVFKCAL